VGFKRKKLEADLKIAQEEIERLEESKRKMLKIMVSHEEHIAEVCELIEKQLPLQPDANSFSVLLLHKFMEKMVANNLYEVNEDVLEEEE
jgi:hypothetical protein